MATSAKHRDLAVLLPLAGAFLFMSPLILAFNSIRLVFGLPVILLYIFGVWLLLILGAAWLARHLTEDDPALPPAGDPRGAEMPGASPSGSDDGPGRD